MVVNEAPPAPSDTTTPGGITGSDGRLGRTGGTNGEGPFIGGSLPTGGGGGDGDLLSFLRIRGDDPGDTTHFGLEVAEVQVRANGNLLGTVMAPETGLDLARTDHAFLLGAFEIPADAAEVEFLVRFADTGTVQSSAGAFSFDARTAPVTFTASRAQLAERGHAVLHVRLSDALIETTEGLAFLPEVTVRY